MQNERTMFLFMKRRQIHMHKHTHTENFLISTNRLDWRAQEDFVRISRRNRQEKRTVLFSISNTFLMFVHLVATGQRTSINNNNWHWPPTSTTDQTADQLIDTPRKMKLKHFVQAFRRLERYRLSVLDASSLIDMHTHTHTSRINWCNFCIFFGARVHSHTAVKWSGREREKSTMTVWPL